MKFTLCPLMRIDLRPNHTSARCLYSCDMQYLIPSLNYSIIRYIVHIHFTIPSLDIFCIYIHHTIPLLDIFCTYYSIIRYILQIHTLYYSIIRYILQIHTLYYSIIRYILHIHTLYYTIRYILHIHTKNLVSHLISGSKMVEITTTVMNSCLLRSFANCRDFSFVFYFFVFWGCWCFGVFVCCYGCCCLFFFFFIYFILLLLKNCHCLREG